MAIETAAELLEAQARVARLSAESSAKFAAVNAAKRAVSKAEEEFETARWLAEDAADQLREVEAEIRSKE